MCFWTILAFLVILLSIGKLIVYPKPLKTFLRRQKLGIMRKIPLGPAQSVVTLRIRNFPNKTPKNLVKKDKNTTFSLNKKLVHGTPGTPESSLQPQNQYPSREPRGPVEFSTPTQPLPLPQGPHSTVYQLAQVVYLLLLFGEFSKTCEFSTLFSL